MRRREGLACHRRRGSGCAPPAMQRQRPSTGGLCCGSGSRRRSFCQVCTEKHTVLAVPFAENAKTGSAFRGPRPPSPAPAIDHARRRPGCARGCRPGPGQAPAEVPRIVAGAPAPGAAAAARGKEEGQRRGPPGDPPAHPRKASQPGRVQEAPPGEWNSLGPAAGPHVAEPLPPRGRPGARARPDFERKAGPRWLRSRRRCCASGRSTTRAA